MEDKLISRYDILVNRYKELVSEKLSRKDFILAADKDLGHVAHVIRQHKFMIVMPVAVAEPRRHRRHGGVLVAKVRRQKRIQRLEVFQILLVRIIGNIMQYIVFGF